MYWLLNNAGYTGPHAAGLEHLNLGLYMPQRCEPFVCSDAMMLACGFMDQPIHILPERRMSTAGTFHTLYMYILVPACRWRGHPEKWPAQGRLDKTLAQKLAHVVKLKEVRAACVANAMLNKATSARMQCYVRHDSF